MSSWSYPPEFIEALAGFGLAPTAETPPQVLRDALNDLYRHQLRSMRDRLRVGEFEKAAYLDMVVALRKRYWLLTLPLPAWEKICALDPSYDGATMIDLYNAATNELLGHITEADLSVLVDGMEEESTTDQDYFVDAATIDVLADGRATEHLVAVLRKALGSSDGVDIRWARR